MTPATARKRIDALHQRHPDPGQIAVIYDGEPEPNFTPPRPGVKAGPRLILRLFGNRPDQAEQLEAIPHETP